MRLLLNRSTLVAMLMMIALGRQGIVRAEVKLEELEGIATQDRLTMAKLPVRMSTEEWKVNDNRAMIKALTSQIHDSAIPASRKDNISEQIRATTASSSQHYEHSYIADPSMRRYALRTKDLEDVEARLQKFNLPAGQAAAFSAGKKGASLSGYDETGKLVEGQYNDLSNQFSLRGHEPHLHTYLEPPMTAGIVAEGFFAKAAESHASVREIQEGDKTVLSVSFSLGGQSIVGIFDPSINYRILRLEQRTSNGRLVKRELASDYKTYQGYPFPGRYDLTVYDPDTGEIVARNAFRVLDAELAAELTANDFMIDLPAGAMFIDYYGQPNKVSMKKVRQDIRFNLLLAMAVSKNDITLDDLGFRNSEIAIDAILGPTSRPCEGICEKGQQVESQQWRFCVCRNLTRPVLVARVNDQNEILIIDKELDRHLRLQTAGREGLRKLFDYDLLLTKGRIISHGSSAILGVPEKNSSTLPEASAVLSVILRQKNENWLIVLDCSQPGADASMVLRIVKQAPAALKRFVIIASPALLQSVEPKLAHKRTTSVPSASAPSH